MCGTSRGLDGLQLWIALYLVYQLDGRALSIEIDNHQFRLERASEVSAPVQASSQRWSRHLRSARVVRAKEVIDKCDYLF
jgi:hypothetical protein